MSTRPASKEATWQAGGQVLLQTQLALSLVGLSMGALQVLSGPQYAPSSGGDDSVSFACFQGDI